MIFSGTLGFPFRQTIQPFFLYSSSSLRKACSACRRLFPLFFILFSALSVRARKCCVIYYLLPAARGFANPFFFAEPDGKFLKNLYFFHCEKMCFVLLFINSSTVENQAGGRACCLLFTVPGSCVQIHLVNPAQTCSLPGLIFCSPSEG